MPIKAVLGPQRLYLEQADPTKSTWVDIRRRSFNDDIERGKWLRLRTLVDLPDGSMATKVDVNVPRVRLWELYTTYVDTNIEYPGQDAEEQEIMIKPFKPKDQITEKEFGDLIGELDTDVVAEWIALHLSINPEWRSFF